MATSQPALRTPPAFTTKRAPVSRARVESVISRSVATFGTLFGIQTLPAVLSQWGSTTLAWDIAVTAGIYLSLAFALLSSLVQRWVRLSQSLVAIVYLIALQTWPLFVIDPTDATADSYWLYYLLTVATAAAAIGFNTVIATTYLFVAPLIYGLICITPAGGSIPWNTALLSAVYSIILGGIIMVIVTMLRHAAASVDEAQATALERYSHAVRQHATEVERVQVDSIVHDSVLTTLLSAARAYTPESKELAATMAGNAIGHLREAALVVPDDGSTVRLTNVARRVADAAATIGAQFELRTRNIGARSMPVLAAEAVYSAAVQAMVNSLQHAGPDQRVSRWLTIRGLAPAGIEIEVGDTGRGFDLPQVPRERLGLRVSIVERISNAGGAAAIDSALGEGTVVTIRWPSIDDEQAVSA